MHHTCSDEITLNTGAPQGCVLSPLLFSIYTDELRIKNAVVSLVKFADDMALVGLLVKEQAACEQIYFDQVLALQDWCSLSALRLNVGKTKEMIFDLSKPPSDPHRPVLVDGEAVQIVNSFKYLGSHIDNKLTFHDNAAYIFNKAQQRLSLLRKLKSFGVSEKTLETVYKSIIRSVLSFNISVWFGNLSAKNKNMLNRVIKNAGKIIGSQQIGLEDMYISAVRRKAVLIISDSSHPLHKSFETLPSGRRYRVPRCNRNLYKKSFIPSAITMMNSI